MPAICQVELGRYLLYLSVREETKVSWQREHPITTRSQLYLIAHTTRGHILIVPHIRPWIQCPRGITPIEVYNRAKVIHQCDVDVKSACDKPASLEKVVIVLRPRFLGHLMSKTFSGLYNFQQSMNIGGTELANITL